MSLSTLALPEDSVVSLNGSIHRPWTHPGSGFEKRRAPTILPVGTFSDDRFAHSACAGA